MNFYQHTQNWFQGEIFEGKLMLISGILITVVSLLLWKFGTTPNAKSLITPLFIVGLLFSIGTGSALLNYPKRMDSSKFAFNKNPKVFIASEKKRVEDFQILYKYSVIFAAVSFALTILAFGFMNNRTFQSVCIGLMVVAVALIVIDHFSKERAQIYYVEILNNLEVK
jgi:MFS family permease